MRSFSGVARSLAAALVALGALAGPAHAQTKPYEAVPLAFDHANGADEALKGLIERLRGHVAKRDLAAIAAETAPALVIAECDANPLKPCPPPDKPKAEGKAKATPGKPSPPRKPVERLLNGLCCKDVPRQHVTQAMRVETALGLIGAALEEETLGDNTDVPGAACLPAFPRFDRGLAAKMVEAADIEPGNLRNVTQAFSYREKPNEALPVLGTFHAGQVAPLVTDLSESLPDGWSAVARPEGGLAYTNEGGMGDLTPAGVCFARDDAGAWKISLIVQRKS